MLILTFMVCAMDYQLTNVRAPMAKTNPKTPGSNPDVLGEPF